MKCDPMKLEVLVEEVNKYIELQQTKAIGESMLFHSQMNTGGKSQFCVFSVSVPPYPPLHSNSWFKRIIYRRSYCHRNFLQVW